MRSLKTLTLIAVTLLLSAGLASAVNVTFRVNMNVQEELEAFDPAADSVGVNGTINNWGNPATRMFDPDEDGIYEATMDLTAGNNEEFKFVIANDGNFGNLTWEGVDNRPLLVPNQDTILDVIFFNDQETANPVYDYEVIFQVDMTIAIQTGQFDSNTDGMIIRGGHLALGNWGGFTQLALQGGGEDIYNALIQLDAVQVNVGVPYKFLIDDDNDQADPVTWEDLPQGGNRMLIPDGTEPDNDQDGYKEIILDPVFFADNPGGISQELTVTYELDGRPALKKHADVGIPELVNAGITDITFFTITGAWDTPQWNWTDGDEGNHTLYDDGIPPDIQAGDSIFTTLITWPEGTAINFIYKYGCMGFDCEAGVGENRFIQLDDSESEMLVQDQFGEQGDLYTDYLGVREIPTASRPTEFTLAQNYPNPFNPTTLIAFTLPRPGDARLRIFNVAGREVMVQNLGTLNTGRYEVTFDGSGFASGVYFYRIEALGMTQTRKMMLLK